jgi:hypothetical protein
MKNATLLTLCVLFLGCGNSNDYRNNDPTFKDFEKSWCHMTSASTYPNLSSTNLTADQKNDLKAKWLSEDRYFNCDNYILTVDCGAGCQRNLILNAVSGDLIGEINSTNGISFTKESSLIVINASSDPNSKTEFWNVSDNQLLKIK